MRRTDTLVRIQIQLLVKSPSQTSRVGTRLPMLIRFCTILIYGRKEVSVALQAEADMPRVPLQHTVMPMVLVWFCSDQEPCLAKASCAGRPAVAEHSDFALFSAGA